MPNTTDNIVNLILMKVKFAMSSSVATIVDYILYQILVKYFFSTEVSYVLGASVGMLINFFLQKKHIFELNRPLKIAFVISLLVSIGGISIGTYIVSILKEVEMLGGNQFIIKAIATGTMFFYNFYMKRFAFEKRFI